MPGQGAPQQLPAGGADQMPMPMDSVPTGGMPLPSSIPPQVLSALQSGGGMQLNNIQA
jgi:hypothetical protein